MDALRVVDEPHYNARIAGDRILSCHHTDGIGNEAVWSRHDATWN